ncbi:L-glutamine ABC transporter membrane protein /L-glutamate ABC transporter membrane protein /L-aspartate ABC transporter membrane protein /L-asparagine ABC transporter membrane protein [Hasllibacter halocynthiae]|uniref:L-glutamine ABC transporter membrane protein /L-glutamate ABC transporter membrane protein /L-aspartate ABC transporter membrane protein /L-asparagine ABC transporter membrane protein n=1 Tax=Hasllibacter halocynthiae TaxID=595589 RepID=A0A2T0X3S5_9RHOB|nr:ABC transporter permease subunit [Hasllibacter halocynthiae]PRY93514.1 L-glutamine ABC transporter membrane protein /L-glutamate ABC transporter membrane protein /L-aspartate ABC transporter membrane protein /L-asparagine ABC transporter membrane protein [Hasllibacter halocynthiae]
MTTIDHAGRGEGGFRLSQLLYDRRYRSLTIQAVAMILLVLLVVWLVDNTVTNLSRQGKDIDFGFLGTVAGYDINQTLIPYSSQDTHLRAAAVGILNTLLVAFLGCIAATIVGVLAGVARLSRNWLISGLMAVYVEGFRNVPLLLWIIVIFAVMSEGMPQPRAFRGDDPAASMLLGDSVAITNRGIYIPGVEFAAPLAGSTGWTWALILGAVLAGVLAARVVKKRADARQEATGERPVTWPLRLALILGPAIALLFVFGAGLNKPELAGFNFQGGIHMRNSLIALWFALTLYTGAFIAENVRAGILSVSKGQSEAAFALGLRPGRTMSLIILPQALRVIIPPLISQYLNLTKNSSLALAVGYMDVRSTLGGITINQTGRELEGMLLLGLFYLVTSLTISALLNVYNGSVKLKER